MGFMQSSENEERLVGCGGVESKVSDVRLQNRGVGGIVGSIYCWRDWVRGLRMAQKADNKGPRRRRRR
jgi:hypothetical protein